MYSVFGPYKCTEFSTGYSYLLAVLFEFLLTSPKNTLTITLKISSMTSTAALHADVSGTSHAPPSVHSLVMLLEDEGQGSEAVDPLSVSGHE